LPAVIESEISAGKIKYDATAAASCIAGVSFGDCAGFWLNGATTPASCATALVGTVPDGGACIVDFDCSSATSICDPSTRKCGPAPSGSGSAHAPEDRSVRATLGLAAE
jgi:hypothetical protein